MKHIVALCCLCLLFSCITDNSTNRKSEHADKAFEENEEIFAVDSVFALKAINLVTVAKEEFNRRDEDRSFYTRKVDLGNTNGSAFFVNGKIRCVSFNTLEDYEVRYTVSFDPNEKVEYVSLYSKGSDYFSEDFLLYQNKTPLLLNRSGYFGNEPHAFKPLEKEGMLKLSDYDSLVFVSRKIQEAAIRDHNSKNGTHYYAGTIDGKYEIEMNLTRFDNWSFGKYRYKNGETELNVNVNHKGDSILMEEKEGEKVTGIFKGKVDLNQSIEGVWQNADGSKSMPFKLNPSKTYTTTSGEILREISNSKSGITDRLVSTNYFDFPYEMRDQMANIYGTKDLKFFVTGTQAMRDLSLELSSIAFNQSMAQNIGFDGTPNRIKQNYFASVFLLLPDFVSAKYRHLGYYANDAENFDLKKRLAAYSIFRIDRSSENLAVLWNYLKAEHSEMILKGYFTEFDTTANLLISSFDQLQSIPNVEQTLAAIYSKVDSLDNAKELPETGYRGTVNDQWPLLEPLMTAEHKIAQDGLWAYSFWMRRFHEENQQMVYSILIEAKTTIIDIEMVEYD